MQIRSPQSIYRNFFFLRLHPYRGTHPDTARLRTGTRPTAHGSQDLGSIGEFLSSIVVLLTLGYLTLQTRQNTMAIGAQLDAAAFGSVQNSILSAATSNELGEAMAEDSRGDSTSSQLRLNTYWTSVLLAFQWQFRQARRGLLPSFDEAEVAATVRFFFIEYRSVEGTWERMKPSLFPEFVAWVEEQREKAA